jgi:superfamily II DNA or RNA helicase
MTGTGEYTEESENEVVGQIIGDIVGSYKANDEIQGLPFIGFTKTIAQAESLCEEFEEEGYKVAVVHSKLSDDDNKGILDSFKAGALDGVLSVIKLIEGFDYPACSVLIMATAFAPNKKHPHEPNSLTRYVQMIGRVRRSHAGKQVAYIHDHGLNFVRYGHPDDYDESFTFLLSKKKKDKDDDPLDIELRKKRLCNSCGSEIFGITCPVCGHENKATSKMIEAVKIKTLEGTMVNLIDSELSNKKSGKKLSESAESIYAGCLFEFNKINESRKKRGLNEMKRGWIYHKYKDITGKKPPAANPDRIAKHSKLVSNYMKYERIKYFKSLNKTR